MEQTAMAMMTLGEAAKHSGVSKATLSRAIKSGRMSARRNDKNGFDIDPAELFRVFPRNSDGTAATKQTVTPPETVAATPATAVLHAEIEGLRAQLAMMREHMDDVKGQRDFWQGKAEDATQRLLEDRRPAPARRGLFGLFKAG